MFYIMCNAKTWITVCSFKVTDTLFATALADFLSFILREDNMGLNSNNNNILFSWTQYLKMSWGDLSKYAQTSTKGWTD